MNFQPLSLAEELTMATPSIAVLLSLFLLFALAIGMFWLLLAREQLSRRVIAVREWARMYRYRHTLRGPNPPPLPIGALGGTPQLIESLIGQRCTFVRFRLPLPDDAVPSPGSATPAPSQPWHVLIWPISSDWPATALRPASAIRSLADLLQLPPQAAEGTHRYVVCSKDRKAARSLGRSSARGLLPADIGLLLIGKYMLLDFSERPFDDVEFNRKIAVAEQVSAQIPIL